MNVKWPVGRESWSITKTKEFLRVMSRATEVADLLALYAADINRQNHYAERRTVENWKAASDYWRLAPFHNHIVYQECVHKKF